MVFDDDGSVKLSVCYADGIKVNNMPYEMKTKIINILLILYWYYIDTISML